MKHANKIIMLAGVTTVASVFNSTPIPASARANLQIRVLSSSPKEVVDVTSRLADQSVS